MECKKIGEFIQMKLEEEKSKILEREKILEQEKIKLEEEKSKILEQEKILEQKKIKLDKKNKKKNKKNKKNKNKKNKKNKSKILEQEQVEPQFDCSKENESDEELSNNAIDNNNKIMKLNIIYKSFKIVLIVNNNTTMTELIHIISTTTPKLAVNHTRTIYHVENSCYWLYNNNLRELSHYNIHNNDTFIVTDKCCY
jgi:hypothetical protein